MLNLDIESPVLVAEIGQAHDGSLDTAHAYIDAVADAGFDGVKFQTHLAEQETTRQDEFRVRKTRRDEDRFDYWKRMEFSEIEWCGLGEHAKSRNLLFISSVFSTGALVLLRNAPLDAVKVASGDVANTELLEDIARTGKPVVLSSGMSRWRELDYAVRLLRDSCSQLVILQCTSKYPTPLSETGVNLIETIKERYKLPVGLSDHSGSIFPGMFAMSVGIAMLEVHVVFDRRCFGYDVSSSLTFDEVKILSEYKQAVNEMTKSQLDKDQVADELPEIRKLFSRSVGIKQDLKVGTVLSKDLMIPKKPGSGIPYQSVDKLVGRVLVKDVHKNRLLSWEDMGE